MRHSSVRRVAVAGRGAAAKAVATLQWLEESFHVGGRGETKKKKQPQVSDSNKKLIFFPFLLLLFLPCRYVFLCFVYFPTLLRKNQSA